MKAKAFIPVAICGALSLILCAPAWPQAATAAAMTTGASASLAGASARTGTKVAAAISASHRMPFGGAAAHMQAGTTPPAVSPAVTPATFAESANDLYVTVGKTVLVDTAQPISRVAVGLGGIAVAQVISATEIMINGKAPGQTSLIIWNNNGGRQFFNVTVQPDMLVTEDEAAALRRELRINLPDQAVDVSIEGGHIFLRGTVKNLTDAKRAVEIASTSGKVVNLLNVDVPPSKPQILLKVRFASVDLTRAKQLGINLFSLGLGNTVGGITTGQFSPPTITGCQGAIGICGSQAQAAFPQDLNILAYFSGLNGGASIQALETEGVVQVLAQPNLVTEDGKEASFLAGGEYPYPVVQGGAAGTPASVTIEFKRYGISLDFIPTILPNNSIHLQVAPQVSALDYSNEIQIQGFTVPGITTRQVNTEVDLRNGESFVIGGLLSQNVTQTFERIPFISSVPILGKFFQSIQRTKDDTELLVVVTPDIVKPIAANTPLPALKEPIKFLPPNTKIPMHTPIAKNAAKTLPPAPSTMPVEKLVQSMKPEKPLKTQATSGYSQNAGTAGGGAGVGMSGGAP